MKRQKYKAFFFGEGSNPTEDTAYAMNSGIRRTEAMAREYARSHGLVLTADKPNRYEDEYTRVWRDAAGAVYLAAVRLEASS